MIIPANLATAAPSPLANDNTQQPSQTNLLMAAAEMHRMGRLKSPKPKAKSTDEGFA